MEVLGRRRSYIQKESVRANGTFRVRLWDLVTEGVLRVYKGRFRKADQVIKEKRVSDIYSHLSFNVVRFSSINCSL